MRRPLLLAALAAPLGFAPALLDLAGTYHVEGTNFDGSTYEGTLAVVERGEVYQFSWATGQPYEGVGLQRGDAVAAGFGGEGCGVVLYTIRSERGGLTLDGAWALYGTEQTGTERGAHSGGDLTGAYAVEGTNPDGSSYTGTLTIEEEAMAYRLTWEAGGTYVGVALRDGDVLAASYGGEHCGVAGYRADGNTLEGRWTTYGAGGALGAETAVRH